MMEQNNNTIDNPQILFSWKAPMRAYKHRSVGVLRFYIALSLLLSFIAFFFGDKLLIMPIWAIMFLFYVLTITPPPDIEHKITRFGVTSGKHTYRFDFLSHFYFIHKFDYKVLVLVSNAPWSHHWYLVIKDENDVKNIIQILSHHLVYQEVPDKNITDRLAEMLTNLMPEEKTTQTTAQGARPEEQGRSL